MTVAAIKLRLPNADNLPGPEVHIQSILNLRFHSKRAKEYRRRRDVNMLQCRVWVMAVGSYGFGLGYSSAAKGLSITRGRDDRQLKHTYLISIGRVYEL